MRFFLNKPILGVGTGGYQKAMEKFKENPTISDVVHPYNGFLYMAMSFGLLGLVSLERLFAMLFIKSWRNCHSALGFSVPAFIVVPVIGSLTDTQRLVHQTGVLIAVLAGDKDGRRCIIE